MSLYADGVFDGLYTPSTPFELPEADYVTGHEFAAPWRGIGRINEQIGLFIAMNFSHLPIFASQTVADGIEKLDLDIDVEVIKIASSNTMASEGGTWAELQRVKEM